MKDNELQLIDFSQGIRATEIQHNFNALQQQLNKERISVAGAGISYGLDFELNNFTLKISKGCLINNEGQEVFIEETIVDIEKPILIAKRETKLNLNTGNNSIVLSEIPYAKNRLMSANRVPVSESGVSVNISNISGSSGIVNIASIDGRTVYVKNPNKTSLTVDVAYNYTAKRRDIVFIDKDFKIVYRKGITSPSPSVPKLDKNEYTYILGYVEVNGMKNTLDTLRPNDYEASVEVLKEFKAIRNVYTDSSNRLYLCGTPFDSIKVIHVVEPTNPEVDTFWYDYQTNKLKVWRKTDIYDFSDAFKFTSSDPNHPRRFETNVQYLYNKDQISVYVNNKKLVKSEWEEGSDLTELDKQQPMVFSKEFKIIKKLSKGDVISYSINRYDGFEEWIAINDVSQTICEERYIWTPEIMENLQVDFSHDNQFFFFHADKQKNMLYVPGKNSLSVMIDQIPLHSDQFDEITMYDAITGPYATMIKKQLVDNYGYVDNFHPDKINEEYENIGIGFKLNAPLDKNCYMEAIVNHVVNSNPLNKRFQRSATFVEEGAHTYKEYITVDGNTIKQNPVFTTSIPYRYQENQIEVFKNGVLLERNIDYIEVADANSLKGSQVDSFELLAKSGVRDGDRISYRITTNVYSYDHVDGLLSGFNRRLQDIETEVAESLNKVNDKCDYIDEKIRDIETHLDNIMDVENTLDSKYLKRTDRLDKSNLAPAIYKGVAERLINETVYVGSVPQEIDITTLGIGSANDFVIVHNMSRNKILQRDSDYTIQERDNRVYLTATASSMQYSTLYLTGIKFNKA